MDETPNVINDCENFGTVFSLEKMCFDLIVKNFERFHFGFTASKNQDLQRNFEFLQRRFSEQLVSALYDGQTLKEEYFEYLFNKHLTFLDGDWLENSRHLNSLENIFRHLPNLTRLRFSGAVDKILENIAKFCPKIVEIDVRFSYVTDNGVHYLCEKNGTVPCPNIKILLIVCSSITDRGAELLIRSLPLLEKIDYENVPLLLHSIHQEKLSQRKKVQNYNFVKIDLLHSLIPNLTDVLKTCLTVCPNLESLDCSVTEKEQLDLVANSHLKKLNLSMFYVNSKFNIDSFIKNNGYNLTTLNIDNCIISLSILAEHCPDLKEFYVKDVNFAEEEDGVQVTFPCLMKCSFSQIRPSAAKGFCLLLSSSPKLESMSFRLCRLSLTMKNQILIWCKNSSAKEIQFMHLELEMKFARDILLSCPFLKMMYLKECCFDDKTEKILVSLSKRLPNKPYVDIKYEFSLLGVSYNFIDDPAFRNLNLRMQPEDRYDSSDIYDSFYREIALKWTGYDSDDDHSVKKEKQRQEFFDNISKFQQSILNL